MQQEEEPEWKQQAGCPGSEDRGGSILPSVLLSTVLTPVATVALALEVCAEQRQLAWAGFACNPQLAAAAADAVRPRAEVEVHVSVGHFAQTAAATFAHVVTALLGSCRHVEKVAAQRPLEVFVQAGAPELRGRGRKNTTGMLAKRHRGLTVSKGAKAVDDTYTAV